MQTEIELLINEAWTNYDEAGNLRDKEFWKNKALELFQNIPENEVRLKDMQ